MSPLRSPGALASVTLVIQRYCDSDFLSNELKRAKCRHRSSQGCYDASEIRVAFEDVALGDIRNVVTIMPWSGVRTRSSSLELLSWLLLP